MEVSLSLSFLYLILFSLESTDGFESISIPHSPHHHPAAAAAAAAATFTTRTSRRCSTTTGRHKPYPSFELRYSLRDADMMELMVGGQRYEMVPLPDSMMDTTLFVGNLDEFCDDDDLSNLFQAVSTLRRVPACVARKPNYTSLKYGFVTFLTAEEKEAAILRFHGSKFFGKILKVEPIRDHPKMGRVKVPESIVSYVVGRAKKTTSAGSSSSSSSSSSNISSLRSISRLDEDNKKREVSSKELRKRKQLDEDELKARRQSSLVFPLNAEQQEELLRAARRGYLVLEGRGHGRGRKSNALACAHRQYCDEREQPQIVLCKASAGPGSKRSPLDRLVVDLSPLRLTDAVGDELLDDFMVSWKTQILTAAAAAGMELRRDYQEDDCHNLSLFDEDAFEEECGFDDHDRTELTDKLSMSYDEYDSSGSIDYTITLTDEDSWNTEPISRLPVVSLGVFEGERTQAKAMAKELADMWGIPTEPLDEDDSDINQEADKRPRGGKARRHRRNENRRRRRNSQRDLDMFFR